MRKTIPTASTIFVARYPGAFVVSAGLHVAVVVALLLMLWRSRREPPPVPQIFELVAGAGDNYAATEAAAAATPAPPTETVNVELPEAPPVITKELVLPPPPAPVVERTPPPKVEPKIEPKVEPKKAETKQPAPKKAEPKKVEPKKEEPKKTESLVRPTTFQDFVKKEGTPKAAPKAAPPAPIRAKSIDVDRVVQGVAGGSTAVKAGASGTALSVAPNDQAYVAMILDRIRRSMEAAGVTELSEARIEFRVAANGELSAPRILRSTGSAAFDQALITAFRTIRPIGPPPSQRAEFFSVTIRMREAG
jgi:colicin import membrane protein